MSLAAWNVEVAAANAVRISHDPLRLREVLTGTVDGLEPHEVTLFHAVEVHRRVVDDHVALNLAIRRGVQAGGGTQRLIDVEVTTEGVTVADYALWKHEAELRREGVGG